VALAAAAAQAPALAHEFRESTFRHRPAFRRSS